MRSNYMGKFNIGELAPPASTIGGQKFISNLEYDPV